MNKAFEKILEFIDEQIKIEESIAKSENEGHPITHQYGANCMNVVKKFVQEVAEEYNGGWISVNDRLPDKAGSYLVIGKSGGATVTRWYMPSEFYPEGHFGGNSTDYIRYWMPRPEPPKERE